MNTTVPNSFTQYERLAELVILVKKYEVMDTNEALELAQEGLALSRHLSNPQAEVDLHTSLGRIHLLRGDFYDSLRHLSIALEIAKVSFPGDTQRLALIHNYHGIVYHDKNNLEEALFHFTEVLKLDVKDLNLRAYNNMGSLYINAGQYDKAKEFLSKGEQVSIEMGEYFCRIYIYENIARIYQMEEEYEQSNVYYLKAKALIDEQSDEGNNYILSTILNRLGSNLVGLGRHEEAFEIFHKSLEVSRLGDFNPIRCECLCKLGNLHLKIGDITRFLALHQEALTIAKNKKLRLEQIECLTNLRDYSLREKDFQQAYDYLLQIDALKSEKIEELQSNNLTQILGRREFEIFQLKQKNEMILRQNQELEQFAHIVAHDLKEPLRNINSYANLLTRRYRGALDEEADEFIGFISRNVVQMNALLSDLLKYTSLEKSEISKEDLSLTEIVDNVRFSLTEKIKTTGAVIEVGKLPQIQANKLHMELLFQNLIQNAIKFAKPDVSSIVHIGAVEKEDYFEIWVKDNGIGIPEDYHDKIFKIFRRLDRHSYEGTGMGLAICEKIVSHYGGKLWVDSAEGEGSTFHFTIPKTLN